MDREAPLPANVYQNRWTERINRSIDFLARHWLFWLNWGVGLYATLPWMAPLAQAAGWTYLGRVLFRLYTPLCHQNPAFSYHLFGYQVAYCQRDTAIYTTILLAGLAFALLRRSLRPIPWSLFFLALVPMALDGLTQAPRALLTEWPLRTENPWAVALTGGVFSPGFYVGDAVGSLNWWLRTISGVLFGLSLVLALYPRIEMEMRKGSGGSPGHPLQQGHALDVEGLRKEVHGHDPG